MGRVSTSRRITDDMLRNIIVKRLPKLLEKEPALRDYLANLLTERFADKTKTEETIEEILLTIREQNKRLEEHSKTLEEQNKRLEEHSRILEEQNKRLKEHSKILEEQNKRLEEHSKTLEEQNKRLEEHSKRLEEHSKRLEEHSKILGELLKEVKSLRRDYDRTLSALGARWGLYSERSFREGLKAILERDFGVKVERYCVKDEEGKVFGKPDQVEIDLIIRNGKVFAVEIKSSGSKADLSIFWKKVKFYEEREGKKVDRKIFISPMVDPFANNFAKETGIEVYCWPEEIEFNEI